MKKKKILIADDNKFMRDVLEEIMEIGGYDHNSISAIHSRMITNDLPDLILMDIKMSGADGRDICKQLKSEDKTKNIPIILLSASHQLNDSALEAGADDFIAKPFNMMELLGKINCLLK